MSQPPSESNTCRSGREAMDYQDVEVQSEKEFNAAVRGEGGMVTSAIPTNASNEIPILMTLTRDRHPQQATKVSFDPEVQQLGYAFNNDDYDFTSIRANGGRWQAPHLMRLSHFASDKELEDARAE